MNSVPPKNGDILRLTAAAHVAVYTSASERGRKWAKISEHAKDTDEYQNREQIMRDAFMRHITAEYKVEGCNPAEPHWQVFLTRVGKITPDAWGPKELWMTLALFNAAKSRMSAAMKYDKCHLCKDTHPVDDTTPMDFLGATVKPCLSCRRPTCPICLNAEYGDFCVDCEPVDDDPDTDNPDE